MEASVAAMCEACSAGIPMDAPIYLRRDRVYCSEWCRRECPRPAKAFSYEAYQGTVPLSGSADALQPSAAAAVREEVAGPGLARQGPSVAAGLWRMAKGPAASPSTELEQAPLNEASIADYMPIETARWMVEGVELLGRTALKCAAWPLQVAAMEHSLEDSLVRTLDTVSAGPMIKDHMDAA